MKVICGSWFKTLFLQYGKNEHDETHYVRLWENKELKDLKLLIDLTRHWIEMELITKELIIDMPEG